MQTIRPITRCLPDSKELLDETGLPLCVVVTPCATEHDPPTATDPTAAAAAAMNKAVRLSSVPKCLQCGAPHPTKATRFRPNSDSSFLLCYLCGKTSSTKVADQRKARIDEWVDPEIYDQIKFDNNKKEFTFDVPIDPTKDIYKAPAMEIPPVWWIVLDASQIQNKEYWNVVASVLESTIAEAPPHVHVGMVSADSQTVSSWDLTSPIPHVRQYPLPNPNTTTTTNTTKTKIDLCLVPVDALHRSCIQAALRAVADSMSGIINTTTKRSNKKNSKHGGGIALGLTLKAIVEFMGDAEHPGVDPQDDPTAFDAPLKFAGGRILCLLGGKPPCDFETLPVEPQQHYFQGGVAGACSGQDKWDGEMVPEEDPSDLTPKRIKEYAKPMKPEDYFQDIGLMCAGGAMGVDVIVVVPEEEDDEDAARLKIQPWYGVPLLRVLTDTTGARGPLILGTRNTSVLKEQVLARTPWQRGMTFGTNLRCRISPGYYLEDTPIDRVGKEKNFQLALYQFHGGMTGPGVNTKDGLWVLGSCDSHTSVVLDYEVEKMVDLRRSCDGYGDVDIKPVIQTCVAYTCVEQDEDGAFYTVRKMKVSSLSMQTTEYVEPLLDALDPEALVAVLFNKLALSAYQEGFKAVPETAEGWLEVVLTSVYESALVEQVLLEELVAKKGRPTERGTKFKARERLLDEERGELSVEDVLMGKGHDKVAFLPLLVFTLLQCDALRPSCGAFCPSMDARCAAMVQMAYMPPSDMAKCLAPTLQLWSLKDDKPIVDLVDLNRKAMQKAVEDKGVLLGDGVFVLNSPQQILVYRSDRTSVDMPFSGELTQLGPNLKEAVEAAAKEYATPPPIRYEMENPENRDEAEKWFDKFLIEDKPAFCGTRNYSEWRAKIATLIRK